MAWGVLTKDGRQRVAGVLRALLITQLVISLVMVIFCYNASVKVMSLLKNIHKFTVYLLYALILLQAYGMKLHYTSGFRLLSWLLDFPHWPRAGPVTRLWLISGCLAAVNGLLVYAACRSTLKALMKELSSSLRIGIAHYLTEPAWKKLIDTMQVELNCCGVEHPSDWHEAPWINLDFLNESSKLVMKISSVDGKVMPPVSPYSCCSPYVLSPCYHDPLQQLISEMAGPILTGLSVTDSWQPPSVWRQSLPRASLHARACLDALYAPLARVTLFLYFFNILIILLQVVIVLLTYILRSGALEAVARGDWTQHHHTFEQIDTNINIDLRAVAVRKRRSRRKMRTRSYPYLS